MCFKHKGETSHVFQTVNGVRQGGVLSPVLFTLYTDVLLHRLEDSGFGCTVGQEYFGVLCYADDITLLSPTLYGLQNMLAICEQFGNEYNINYNPKKTVCLCFCGKQLHQDTNCATLYGKPIPWSSSAKHLGNIVSADLSDTADIQRKKCDFIGRVNSLVSNFKSVPRSVCSHVFNSQCCHFYGTEVWNLQNSTVKSFHVAWRKAIRRMWYLPNMTRSVILPHLVKSDTIEIQLAKRFMSLYKMVWRSNNDRLKNLLQISQHALPNGLVASNMAYAHTQTMDNAACYKDRANVIRDITQVIEGHLHIDNFAIYDLKDIMHYAAVF